VKRLRIGFVVQGEGRGHMTQALALARFVRDAGHEVSRVWVGVSPHRSLPPYFVRGIDAEVDTFAAPVQVPDRRGIAMSPANTVADVVRRIPDFARATRKIHDGTRQLDLVVNFLDLLGGMSRVLHASAVPSVAVAHNYIFLHPELHPLPGSPLQRKAVLVWTRATAARSALCLALSFTPRPAVRAQRLEVAPPLLRAGLDAVPTSDEGFLLAYALNPGYGDLLAAWQRARPHVEVRCYVDGGAGALRSTPGPGFQVRDLDQERFLRDLGRCRAFVGSAGFEAICEAFYLGKPVLAVPTARHFEQELNAWDAERHGVARAGTYRDLDPFWACAPRPCPDRLGAFRAWVRQAPALHVEAVERAARNGRP